MWLVRYTWNILFGKPPGKVLRGRSKRGWRNNIQINIIEIVCEDVAKFDIAQGRAH
jgi:hypothetical protein